MQGSIHSKCTDAAKETTKQPDQHTHVKTHITTERRHKIRPRPHIQSVDKGSVGLLVREVIVWHVDTSSSNFDSKFIGTDYPIDGVS